MTKLTKILIWMWILLTITFVVSQFKINFVLYVLNWIYSAENVLAVPAMLMLLNNERKAKKLEQNEL